MKRHVILVGLPGSGKSTVGALAAARLEAPFFDVDPLIEEREGIPVPRIFEELGEAYFRGLERDVVAALLRGEPAVIAPGGGWAAHPGNLDRLDERSFVLHLATTPETAARRLRGHGDRPLLAGDPLERLEALWAERRGAYRLAEAVVDTNGRTTGEVSERVVELARLVGGW